MYASCPYSKGIYKTFSLFWMSNDFPFAFLIKKCFIESFHFSNSKRRDESCTWNWSWWNFGKSIVVSLKIEEENVFSEKILRTSNWFNKCKYLVWCWWWKGTKKKRKQNEMSKSCLKSEVKAENSQTHDELLIQCQKREPAIYFRELNAFCFSCSIGITPALVVVTSTAVNN